MFLEISQNSQENTCARVSFLIKFQAAPAISVNFAKFLRTLYSQNTSGRLLLYFEIKDVDLFAKEFKTHVHCYREFTRGFNNGSRASVNDQNHSDNVSITF